jgi:hypothetical protein
MIHFAILHSVHREQQTLLECIKALHLAGAESIRVLPDNGTFGAFKNWNRAMKAIEKDAEGYDLLCVLDEDFIVYREALVKVAALGRDFFEDGNACALMTMEQNIPHELRNEEGWVSAPFGFNTWGGGIVMAHHTASRLMSHSYYRRYLNTDKEGRLIDAVPFETLNQMGAMLMQHLPSLSEHIGTESSLLGNDHTGGLTRGFRFNEWDHA